MSISDKDIIQVTDYIEHMTYKMKVMELTCLHNLESPLSVPELQVLVFLGGHGPNKMGEIAEHLFTSLSNLTVIVDKLVKKDIAERCRSKTDRRVVMVSLTESGKEQYEAHRQTKLDLSRKMLAALDESERRVYLELIRKISANIE